MSALVSSLVQIRMTPKQAEHLGVDVANSLTATGASSQSTAYALTANVNRFTTVTSTNNSTALPQALRIANGMVVVRNDDAVDVLQIFPFLGDSINSLAANLPIYLLPGATAYFERLSDTSWIGSVDGGNAGIVIGNIQMTFAIAAPVGYLLLQGGTIGDLSSGATLLVGPIAQGLFEFLWNNLANAQAPVSTGRGASATADFNAHKTITAPDMRQRFPIGLAAAGTGSVLGGTGGAIDHTHTSAAHTHTSAAHTHTVTATHTHTAPAHYHGVGTGADINITSSGQHTHAVKVVPGGAQNEILTDNLGNNTYSSAATLVENTGQHVHAVGNFAGRIGLVTGGVDGNAAMTTGATSSGTTDSTTPGATGSTTPADTGSNNPPFIAVNFIIKY